MSIYAININEKNDSVWETVRTTWPRHYIVSDTLAFIAPPDPTTLTADIAEAVGMNATGRLLGVVIEVGNYFGYSSNALWEWMGKADA